VARGRILAFFIDLLRRLLNTLALPCECVIRSGLDREVDDVLPVPAVELVYFPSHIIFFMSLLPTPTCKILLNVFRQVLIVFYSILLIRVVRLRDIVYNQVTGFTFTQFLFFGILLNFRLCLSGTCNVFINCFQNIIHFLLYFLFLVALPQSVTQSPN